MSSSSLNALRAAMVKRQFSKLMGVGSSASSSVGNMCASRVRVHSASFSTNASDSNSVGSAGKVRAFDGRAYKRIDASLRVRFFRRPIYNDVDRVYIRGSPEPSVWLTVPVQQFGINKEAKSKLISIAGPRYDSSKDAVRFHVKKHAIASSNAVEAWASLQNLLNQCAGHDAEDNSSNSGANFTLAMFRDESDAALEASHEGSCAASEAAFHCRAAFRSMTSRS